MTKYGFRIGNAKEDIPAGTWIHTHNLKTALGDLLEYEYHPIEAAAQKKDETPEAPENVIPLEGGDAE